MKQVEDPRGSKSEHKDQEGCQKGTPQGGFYEV